MSIAEQITARVTELLSSVMGSACPVERSREDAISRAEAPFIIVAPVDEESEAFADGQDKTTFILALEITARGNPWDQAANAIADRAHAAILTDSQIAAMVARVRRNGAKWEGHEADLTAGVLTRHYRFVFVTPAGSL